jgi:SAM-dependent methyltransferase
MITSGRTHAGMDRLMISLNNARSKGVRNMADLMTREDLIEHPLAGLIHQDPLTWHAFSRPRGYPGDAELLDHIYAITRPEGLSATAREINEYCVATGACRSVRARRQILADRIDQVADEVDNPRVVSIACGHLREAAISRAIAEGRVGELIAVDQDEESLTEVAASYPGSMIRPCTASVRHIITGRVTFTDVDLVYAAGLYDYLELPVARRLTSRMFEMLRPGGRLLVANFAPNLREIGYMETFMDWHLIYRDEIDMIEVAREIDRSQVRSLKLYRDTPGNLVFLEIEKS